MNFRLEPEGEGNSGDRKLGDKLAASGTDEHWSHSKLQSEKEGNRSGVVWEVGRI